MFRSVHCPHILISVHIDQFIKNTEIVRKEKILENLEINIEMLTREEAAENSGE